MPVNTYYATGQAMTGSSGFTNFIGRMSEDRKMKLHESMKAELGEHVIVNGNDDLRDKLHNRPEYFHMQFKKETGTDGLLALYHSGISGITKSGIVVTPETFDAMTEWYEKTFGHAMVDNPHLTIIYHSNSTAL